MLTAASSSAAGRLPGHAAAKGTPSSNPTWQPWTNYCNAVVIFRDIQAHDGKIRVLRAYIEPNAPCVPAAPPCVSRPNPPSNCSMTGVSIVPVAGRTQRVYIAVSILGYSRRFHVMAAPCCDAEHTYESLVRAFAWFGGVTRQVWVDNHKAAVTAHVPGAVRFNERFKQLARHYGFVPKACRSDAGPSRTTTGEATPPQTLAYHGLAGHSPTLRCLPCHRWP